MLDITLPETPKLLTPAADEVLFVTNADLPDLVGIGKGTSRGFGIIRKLTGQIPPL